MSNPKTKFRDMKPKGNHWAKDTRQRTTQKYGGTKKLTLTLRPKWNTVKVISKKAPRPKEAKTAQAKAVTSQHSQTPDPPARIQSVSSTVTGRIILVPVPPSSKLKDVTQKPNPINPSKPKPTLRQQLLAMGPDIERDNPIPKPRNTSNDLKPFKSHKRKQNLYPPEYFTTYLPTPSLLVRAKGIRPVSEVAIALKTRREEEFDTAQREAKRRKVNPKLVVKGAGVKVDEREKENKKERERERLKNRRKKGLLVADKWEVKRVEKAVERALRGGGKGKGKK